MEYVWELILPYIAAIGGAGGAGVIIYVTVRFIINKLFKKNNALLNANFNVDNISQKVAEKLAGKTLNIDVTAVTEKALKKLAKELDSKITKIETATNSLKLILVSIGKGVIKLKALTKEEVNELANAIKTIEGEYVPQQIDEPMTVLLQPIDLNIDTSEEVETKSGINFEGF